MEKFTVDYFIKKFEAIPETKWITSLYDKNSESACALGHCGAREHAGTFRCTAPLEYTMTDEATALLSLFNKHFILTEKEREEFKMNPYSVVTHINDNGGSSWCAKYQQPTPKQRILAALYDIKKLSEPVTELPSPEMDFVKATEIKEQNKNLILVN